MQAKTDHSDHEQPVTGEVMFVETKDGRNEIGSIKTIVFHHQTIIPAGLQKVLLSFP
jgi:hypothetical protein